MKERDLSIELIRVITMFLIVLGHFAGIYFPIVAGQAGFSGNVIESVGRISFFVPFHINLFILISGYCGVTRTRHSLIKNYCVLFSSILMISAVALIAGCDYDFTKELLLPLSHNPWWYMRIYAVACLILPVAEKILAIRPTDDLRNLVLGLLAVDVWFGFYCRVDSIQNGGYDLLHFITVYLIGSYLRRAEIKTVLRDRFRLGFKELSMIFVMIMAAKLAYYLIMTRIGLKDWFMDYNQPFNIALSVVAFLALTNIKVRSSWLLFFSSSMVGVYLFHTHPVGESLIREALHRLLTVWDGSMVPAVAGIIVLTLAIMLVCVLLDKARSLLLGRMYGLIDALLRQTSRILHIGFLKRLIIKTKQ